MGPRGTGRFFTRALAHGSRPTEVSTDRAPAYPRVLDEVLPAACHIVEQYATDPIEADHGRFKARLRPMRGLKRLRSAGVIGAGHAFVQNLMSAVPGLMAEQNGACELSAEIVVAGAAGLLIRSGDGDLFTSLAVGLSVSF